MQTVGETLGLRVLKESAPHEALASATHVGVELELEGVDYETRENAPDEVINDWSIEEDGSLRDNGVEFITRGGKSGVDLHRSLTTLCDYLKTIHFEANDRCSTHFHINMGDATSEQLIKMYLLYAACEPLLFEAGGSYRRSSNFCVPVSESMAFSRTLLMKLGLQGISRDCAPFASKYSALNVLPSLPGPRPYGTVEFRGAGPLTTVEGMLKVINPLLSLKKYAMEFEGSKEDMLDAVSSGALSLVFPDAEWDGDDLGDAMVNAWILCKAADQGARIISQARARRLRPPHFDESEDLVLEEMVSEGGQVEEVSPAGEPSTGSRPQVRSAGQYGQGVPIFPSFQFAVEAAVSWEQFATSRSQTQTPN